MIKFLLTLFIFLIPNITYATVNISGRVIFSGNVALNGGTTATFPLKIMPLGDSITRGSTDTPDIFGYRDHLQDSLGIGAYNFVGPFKDPTTNATYDVDHDGEGGDDTNNIISRLSSNLSTYLPLPNNPSSKILLMIGTNDIKDGFSEATTVNNVETIINTIVAYDPTIKIYVATIIPSTNATWNANFTSYNTALVTRLTSMMISNSNLHRVDMNAKFRTCNGGLYTTCYNDSLHPKDIGYQSIAAGWYSCILSSSNTYCDGN